MHCAKTFIAKKKKLVCRQRRSDDADFDGICTRDVHVALPGGRLANCFRYARQADLLDSRVDLSRRHIHAPVTDTDKESHRRVHTVNSIVRSASKIPPFYEISEGDPKMSCSQMQSVTGEL